MGLLRGNSAFASKIDALIATADQFDRGEGQRAVASSAVVVRWYIDRPGLCRHAIHTGKGSLRPLRSQPLERLWFLASGSGARFRPQGVGGAGRAPGAETPLTRRGRERSRAAVVCAAKGPPMEQWLTGIELSCYRVNSSDGERFSCGEGWKQEW